jgi:octaprenyl-diphosphate synthase
MVAVGNHKSLRQNRQAAVKDAHVDVQWKGRYTLALKKGRSKGDHCRISRAQKFFHTVSLPRTGCGTRAMQGSMGGAGEDRKATTPQDRLSAWLAEDMAAVNALIRQRMASEHAPRIPEVTAHLVEAGGKRLRPLLTLAAARMLGYQGEDHIKLAATVEFIHTATLLHDDVVDESQRRRGRPTANLLWDNKSSVLVGDYLFSRSFQLMVETGNLRVLDILANASATIAEGEVLQLTAAQDLATDEGVYLQVVRGKTAALFSAATEVGGVIAGAPEDQIAALRNYGDALGIAFQIVDDILDYGGSDAAIGKNTGDDFRERKLTLPLIKAVAMANSEERAFWERVIEKGDQRENDLAQAMVILRRHDAIAGCRTEARIWSDRARAALYNLPVNPLRQMLSELVEFVISRIS